MNRYIINAFENQLYCPKTKKIRDRDRRPLFVIKGAPGGDIEYDRFACFSCGDLIDFYTLKNGNGAYVIYYRVKDMNYWEMHSDEGYVT